MRYDYMLQVDELHILKDVVVIFREASTRPFISSSIHIRPKEDDASLSLSTCYRNPVGHPCLLHKKGGDAPSLGDVHIRESGRDAAQFRKKTLPLR
jgi:hypothetical protein